MSAAAAHPRRSVAELAAGERVDDQIYRVQQKDLRTTSNGGLYIHVVVADGSGQMLARMWNATQEIYDSIPEGGLLRFRGRVENYKGQRQFIIDGLRAVAPGEADPSAFLPSTRQDVAALWNGVKEILRSIRHKPLLALIGSFVNDADFAARFQRAPAAVQFHHAYLGGLLEHTHNLLRVADAVCPLYPQISRDLVIAGIFLHDAGKCRELAYETNFEYTNEGQLLGHIAQGLLWLHDQIRRLEQEQGEKFPADVEMVLKHILLAHHGKYEFGSPRLPAVPEAILVHYLDNIDAKLAMAFEAMRKDNEPTDWTEFVRALESRVFKPDVLGVRPKS